MKTIIAGSRTATRFEDLLHAVMCCGWEISEVVSGGARGADKMGEMFAKERHIPLKQFLPDWDTYGKSAGIICNDQMAKYAEALIALWDGQSKGTNHMIHASKKRGMKVYVYRISGPE